MTRLVLALIGSWPCGAHAQACAIEVLEDRRQEVERPPRRCTGYLRTTCGFVSECEEFLEANSACRSRVFRASATSACVFQVPSSSAFALLANVGEDCPGAVQLVRPERAPHVLDDAQREVQWLSEAEIAVRLRELRRDQSAWRSPTDEGKFSLAGAQPKTALLYERGRFGIPAGRLPTTHILKPPLADLDGHAENEHLCLALARALGLPAAASRLQRFDGEIAVVVERYDRARVNGVLVRVHQEDMCQALTVRPSAKYQNQGGPTPAQLIALLREHSSKPDEDVATFVDALIFNWLIGGSDAHAKNYSLLLGARGRVRLAPLYDLASALVYRHFDIDKLKLAMKIGSSFRLKEIERRHWQALAREARLNAPRLIERARQLTRDIREAVPALCEEAKRDGLTPAVVDRLAKAVDSHAARCAGRLD